MCAEPPAPLEHAATLTSTHPFCQLLLLILPIDDATVDCWERFSYSTGIWADGVQHMNMHRSSWMLATDTAVRATSGHVTLSLEDLLRAGGIDVRRRPTRASTARRRR